MCDKNLEFVSLVGHLVASRHLGSDGHSVCECSKPPGAAGLRSNGERNLKTCKGFERYSYCGALLKHRHQTGRGPPNWPSRVDEQNVTQFAN